MNKSEQFVPMEGVKCMDSDENLDVWGYLECDNDTPGPIKAQRGLVKDKEGNFVASSFGYTDEISSEQVDDLKSRISDIHEWDFFYSLEATLLRLFYHKDRWYLVTHKKLDAFKSRWSCKQTFGELFVNGLEDVLQRNDPLEWLKENLPRDKIYFFLVRSNQQNRIVCQTNHIQKNETILFMGFSEENKTFTFYERGNSSVEVLNGFSAPEKVDREFASIEDLVDTVEGVDPFIYQGIIGFKKGVYESVKILHKDYLKYSKVRGNNPNLRFRYLEVRNDPELLKLLYVLYPKYTILFDEYESTLYEIARMIYYFYVSRYIKNQYITLPREEYIILKKCHQWYLQDRKNNRIFTQKVMEILAQEPPLNLYKMIRRFNLEQAQFRHMRPLPLPLHHPEKSYNIPVFSRSRNRSFFANLPAAPSLGEEQGHLQG